MNRYDYDILKTFDDVLGKDAYFNLTNNISDYDMLRLATELLRDARDRLDSDLKNENINNEYKKIDIDIKDLESIIDNYV